MNWSARSSVPINVEQLFNPAVTLPQEKSTNGFYAESIHAVSDALSTRSGLCLTLKTSPTVVRYRSQLCAESSLRGASTLHFLTALEQSTRSTHLPFFPARFRTATVLGADFERENNELLKALAKRMDRRDQLLSQTQLKAVK